MKKVTYYLLMISVLLSSCTDDENFVPNQESLPVRLQQIFEASDFPGFTIGIVKNGNPAYQESFGKQDIENNIAYNNKTLQPITSISETFIGAATVKAIELVTLI
jgi:CubicO group peptidase (beta-lactamase class C family)